MINLFSTFIHEIGHSNDPNSVMYAFYSTDDIKLELQTDDIYGIQSLYDPSRPVIPTTTTTRLSPELCEVKIIII